MLKTINLKIIDANFELTTFSKPKFSKMDNDWVQAMQYQRAVSMTHSSSDYSPITGIQDLFELPSHMPPNYDFSKLTQQDYEYILSMAKKEIEDFKQHNK